MIREENFFHREIGEYLVHHVEHHFSGHLLDHGQRQFSEFRFLGLDHVVQRSVWKQSKHQIPSGKATRPEM